VLVRSTRADGAPSTLGADIVVELPRAFDSSLSILQRNGATDVAFAGNARAIELQSGNGTCQVASSATAAALNVHCDNGDLAVTVTGAPPGSEPRTIGTEVGNIAVSFVNVPVADRFSVQAAASDAAVQIMSDAMCQVQETSASAKTVSCHGATSADPVYRVNAGSLSDVTLTF
jgi:hypothetical protein